MRTLLTWIARLWKWIASSFRTHRPYDQKLNLRLRVLIPQADGSVVAEEDATKWGFVSRHGLLQAGIICPYCEHEAAQTGKLGLIHVTRFGEAVNCPNCNAVLLASPDDDVDPVSPHEPYDEAIYHTFAKPAKKRRLGQKMTSTVPIKGDWVVITSDRLVPQEVFVGNVPVLDFNAAPVNYFGTEGRVDDVSKDGSFIIALSGNHGIGGAGLAPGSGIGGAWGRFDRKEIAVMVSPTLRPGDKVRITRGEGQGKEGAFASGDKGRVTVVIDDGQEITVPIERVEKVVENELVV